MKKFFKKNFLLNFLGIYSILATTILISKNNKFKVEKQEKEKFRNNYYYFNCWIDKKNRGKSIYQYLLEHKYKKIAIYGMGEFGMRLYEEIINTEIEIAYTIDMGSSQSITKYNICSLKDDLEDVDAVIVTVIDSFEKIRDQLRVKVDADIISLIEIIYDL